MNATAIIFIIYFFFSLVVKTIEDRKKFKKQIEMQENEKEKDRQAFREIVKEILKERSN